MKKLYIFVLHLLLISCHSEEIISISNFISLDIEPKDNIPADGSTLVLVTVDVDSKVNKGTKVKFFTSNGLFIENKKKEIEKEIIHEREVNGTKFKTASAVFKAPTQFPSTAEIYVKVDKYFSEIDAIQYIQATPISIELEANGSGIPNDYSEEVVITGNLKSQSGFPSNGVKTQLKFFLGDSLINDFPLRNAQLSSGNQGEIFFTISGGGLTVPNKLRITAILEDFPEISDTIVLPVYKKE